MTKIVNLDAISQELMSHAYLLDGSTFVSGAKLQSPNVIISLLAMLLILSHEKSCC